MKALELADSVEKNWSTGYREQIVSELRRLASVETELERIKALEPVAWLSTDRIGERYLAFGRPLDNDPVQPLYALGSKT
jgi:hypothetical protein